MPRTLFAFGPMLDHVVVVRLLNVRPEFPLSFKTFLAKLAFVGADGMCRLNVLLYFFIWKGKAINIEYGNIEKKGNIESMLTKNEKANGPPWGGVGGWLLMMIGDAMTPLTPRLTPSSMLFNIEFDVTVFDVPVFDVNCLYPSEITSNILNSSVSDIVTSLTCGLN